jgi:hypothetical protein
MAGRRNCVANGNPGVTSLEQLRETIADQSECRGSDQVQSLTGIVRSLRTAGAIDQEQRTQRDHRNLARTTGW